jgi:hypothetical protein
MLRHWPLAAIRDLVEKLLTVIAMAVKQTVRLVSFLADEEKILGIEKGRRSPEPPFHHGLRTAEFKI